MNVKDALKTRHSARAFLDRDVDKEKITTILEAARFAPSGANTQPWQVAVVQGQMKQLLDKKLAEAFYRDEPEAMEYQYYPQEWENPYKSRRRACGLILYSTLGIHREDKQRMQTQWAQNYCAFGAPTVLYFFIDPILAKGSYMDYGMFLQSIMLAAVDEGLATCAQAALGQYPTIVKNTLGIDQTKRLLCGMALGYEDTDALVNTYRTEREEVDTFTQFYN